MNIRGVFFDLGGTLFSYRNVARATLPLLVDAMGRLGIERDMAAVKDAYTQAGKDANLHYSQQDYYLHSDFFGTTFRRFGELLDAPIDDTLAGWYLEAHRVAIIDCLALKEDCIETLTHLKAADLYLSVVSNIDDDMLLPLVERESLQQFFHHYTSSEAARSCKPHRGFFEHALELSGLNAEEVLFVGDSPEHDIAGAHAVGMQTALVSDGGMPPPLLVGRETVAPDHTLDSLSDLIPLLTKPD